jgi:beta-N-acetylhexosaminidase
MALGALNDEEMAYEFGRLTAIGAKADGYNVVFGPIVDIAMNPLSSCVGPRAFAGNKELVARIANAAIRGYQDNGMVVTAKHFPGFGESPVDSHIGMVYLDADEKTLIERDLFPYISAIKNADLSGIMMGHIMVPKIDPEFPATISAKHIALMRKIGFDGLAMTDSLAMVGMTNRFGLKECHGLAMAAGIDMVMTSYRLSTKTAYGYMLEAYEKGMVTDEQINSAVRRVLAAQARTLIEPATPKLSDADKAIPVRIARESVAAVLDGVDSPAIDPMGKHLFLIEKGAIYEDPQTGELASETHDLTYMTNHIMAHFPNSKTYFISMFPSGSQIEHALVATMDYESVVAIVHNSSRAYRGSTDITRRMKALLDGISHKLSAILLFGNPHAAREFPKIPRVIFGFETYAYEDKNCEKAAIEILAGKAVAKGRLPL